MEQHIGSCIKVTSILVKSPIERKEEIKMGKGKYYISQGKQFEKHWNSALTSEIVPTFHFVPILHCFPLL